jgi:hypothetical protein
LIDARKLRRSYKHKISNFHKWEQKSHASSYLLYPQNIGPFLSIDEVSLSKGEIYTYVTNKEAKGKKGTLVASIKGTLSQDIIRVLNQIYLEQMKQVKEVTLDMANHFHVIKLAMEALQHIRVKNRWEEMDKENLAITQAKEKGEKYKPTLLPNENTPKQLLARCRYVIVKNLMNGHQAKKKEQGYYLKDSQRLKKHITMCSNSEPNTITWKERMPKEILHGGY